MRKRKGVPGLSWWQKCLRQSAPSSAGQGGRGESGIKKRWSEHAWDGWFVGRSLVAVVAVEWCYSSVAVVRPSDSIRGASASMSVHPDGTVTVTENITDIHNYLQSFNKEIGESSDAQGGTTFYAIDTSQVNTLQG